MIFTLDLGLGADSIQDLADFLLLITIVLVQHSSVTDYCPHPPCRSAIIKTFLSFLFGLSEITSNIFY